MLAGDLQLAPLLLDLAEQPSILDRQHRLGCEGLQELRQLGREGSGCLAPHDEGTHDLVLADQGHGKAGPKAEATEQLAQALAVRGVLVDVGDLDRMAHGRRASHRALAQVRRVGRGAPR